MRRTIPIIMVIIYFFLCFTFTSCKAQEKYEPLFKCSKVLAEPYGICSHINREGLWDEYDTREYDLSMMDSIGSKYVRTDFDWEPMKTGAGNLNFLQFDNMVHSAIQHKKTLLGILTVDKRNYVSEDWLKYVTAISKRYKKSITYWEALNEEEYIYRYVPGFYANQYVDFLIKGYKAVKRGNKKARVLFSGVSDIKNPNVDSILRQNVAPYFDIMNIHAYTWQDSEPEGLIDYYKDLNNYMSKYAINKPVWLTETGATTSKESGVSEKTQCERLPRIYLLSLALGVDKVFWYKSRSCEMRPSEKEDHFGLWHKDYTPKPAYYAYKTLTRMCPNKSTRPRLERFGDVYVASWKRPAGEKLWALWTSRNTEKVAVEFDTEVYKVYDVSGNEIEIDLNNVEITPSIVYVSGPSKLSFEEK